jgi:hypothetical protein
MLKFPRSGKEKPRSTESSGEVEHIRAASEPYVFAVRLIRLDEIDDSIVEIA